MPGAERSVTIVYPEGPVHRAAVDRAPRPGSLQGSVVGVLDNSKPNADVLLRAIAEGLVARHGAARVVHVRGKVSSGLPSSPEAVAGLASECAVVLTGSGD